MPVLVRVLYTCKCVGFGNPDSECPKHNKPLHSVPDKIQVSECKLCKTVFSPDQRYVWRKTKKKKLRVYHTECFVAKMGWSLDIQGKFYHSKDKK